MQLRGLLLEYGNAKGAKRLLLEVLGNSRKSSITFTNLSFRTAPAIAARATITRLRRLREEAAKENA